MENRNEFTEFMNCFRNLGIRCISPTDRHPPTLLHLDNNYNNNNNSWWNSPRPFWATDCLSYRWNRPFMVTLWPARIAGRSYQLLKGFILIKHPEPETERRNKQTPSLPSSYSEHHVSPESLEKRLSPIQFTFPPSMHV